LNIFLECFDTVGSVILTRKNLSSISPIMCSVGH